MARHPRTPHLRLGVLEQALDLINPALHHLELTLDFVFFGDELVDPLHLG